MRRGSAGASAVLLPLALCVMLVATALAAQQVVASAAATTTLPGNDWTEYVHDASGSSYTDESIVTPSNAQQLAGQGGWPVSLGGATSAQPVIANQLVYEGSWNGAETAMCEVACAQHPAGYVMWSTQLGQDSKRSCNPQMVGVASTPALATVTLQGASAPSSVLYVGGGGNLVPAGVSTGASVFALDATTGAIKWQRVVGPAPGHFVWSSPVVFTPQQATHPSVFIGVSSFGDCPLVQGKVMELDATSGAVEHVFRTVPNGCTGGGVWGTPSIDSVTGMLYVATGNNGSCSSSEPYATSLLELNARTLALVSSWQVPASQQVSDSDFGSVPTLFSGTVTPGGTPRSLVGIGNKNGRFYVFDRTDIGAGPLATLQISNGGSCPQCGQGTIAPAAWDGQQLYVGGGSWSDGTTTHRGVVHAFNSDNLATPVWSAGLDSGPVLGALVASPGLCMLTDGDLVIMLRTDTGQVVFSAPNSSSSTFDAPPALAHGVLYAADMSGSMHAWSLNGT
jgi:outer membrane protein assembly factor BamB